MQPAASEDRPSLTILRRRGRDLCDARLVLAALALGCGTPPGPAAPPAPAPAPAPHETWALRYEPSDDAWHRASAGSRPTGVYWVLPMHRGVIDGESRGTFDHVGPSCEAFDLGPPPGGRVALCVPFEGRAEPRLVAAPPVEHGLLPLCTRPGVTTCRGVHANVRSTVTPPLSDADLAAIRDAWRAFLLALAVDDGVALAAARARVGCTRTPRLLSSRPSERARLAVTLDELGLWLSGPAPDGSLYAQGDDPHAPIDGAPGLDLRRGADGTWVICDVGSDG